MIGQRLASKHPEAETPGDALVDAINEGGLPLLGVRDDGTVVVATPFDVVEGMLTKHLPALMAAFSEASGWSATFEWGAAPLEGPSRVQSSGLKIGAWNYLERLSHSADVTTLRG